MQNDTFVAALLAQDFPLAKSVVHLASPCELLDAAFVKTSAVSRWTDGAALFLEGHFDVAAYAATGAQPVAVAQQWTGRYAFHSRREMWDRWLQNYLCHSNRERVFSEALADWALTRLNADISCFENKPRQHIGTTTPPAFRWLIKDKHLDPANFAVRVAVVSRLLAAVISGHQFTGEASEFPFLSKVNALYGPNDPPPRRAFCREDSHEAEWKIREAVERAQVLCELSGFAAEGFEAAASSAIDELRGYLAARCEAAESGTEMTNSWTAASLIARELVFGKSQ